MSVYGSYRVTFENPNSTWARAAAMIEPGSTVLDVGCAAGQFAHALADAHGCVVDGVEPDARDAATASRLCRHVWNGRLGEVASGIDGAYDHILMLDVLEHMADPGHALDLVSGLLVPGGSVILSVPNMAHVSVRLQLLQGHFPAEAEGLLDRTHLSFFDETRLLDLVAASPLDVLTLDRITIDLPPATIEAALRAVDLVPTPAFMARMAGAEAVTYQFVARLGVRTGGPPPTVERDTYVAPLTQYWDSVKALQERARDLETQLAALRSGSLRVPRPVARAVRRALRALRR